MPPGNRRPPPKANESQQSSSISTECSASLDQIITDHERLTDDLIDYSGWSRPWVDNLWAYCVSLKPIDCDTISRQEFSTEMMETFGMTCSLTIDRAFAVYKRYYGKADMYPISMFKGVSTMLSSELDRKINYVFDIYDFDFDGEISLSEVIISLKNVYVEDDYDLREENLKALARLLKNLFQTCEHSGNITREYFRARVHEDTVLLEVLGPCLPGSKYRRKFFDLISPDKYGYSQLLLRLEKRRRDRLPSDLKEPTPDIQRYYPIFIQVPKTKAEMRKTNKRVDF